MLYKFLWYEKDVPAQKDGWRLEGSQDKKDWRRNAVDTEGNRRWREEERETTVVGRRDRRKEAESVNEYRKSERRSENVSNRETTESRAPLLSSDRWHDVGGRSSAHESRRDSKWSSRWGPEDKEKDSRPEKKVDADKEDGEKQASFVAVSRAERDVDSRDKWRPRHRQESHSTVSSVYRAAPGFGLEKGRVEVSTGFAPGRGRSSLPGGISGYKTPSGPIGAGSLDRSLLGAGKFASSANTFCYPRGKLLDIYRKHRLHPSFDSVPSGFEEVSVITQASSVEPLAFCAPDAEEEVLISFIQ